MRTVDESAIATHAQLRFRSEYDYALFEYYRSAKVIRFLEQAGATVGGRILDAGCGGGGMTVSLAEEGRSVLGIDLTNRFEHAGHRLARERQMRNLTFARADGMALPCRDGVLDLVVSHAVIEHVADAEQYLRECTRVLRRGGWMFLSTAPYLSFAGAHLPRLKIPIPVHLLLGRRLAFWLFSLLGRHATWALRESSDESTFVKMAERRERKEDDLLELVRVPRLRRQIAAAGLRIVSEQLHLTGTFRRLPKFVAERVRTTPLLQDIAISSMSYVLARD